MEKSFVIRTVWEVQLYVLWEKIYDDTYKVMAKQDKAMGYLDFKSFRLHLEDQIGCPACLWTTGA